MEARASTRVPRQSPRTDADSASSRARSRIGTHRHRVERVGGLSVARLDEQPHGGVRRAVGQRVERAGERVVPAGPGETHRRERCQEQPAERGRRAVPDIAEVVDRRLHARVAEPVERTHPERLHADQELRPVGVGIPLDGIVRGVQRRRRVGVDEDERPQRRGLGHVHLIDAATQHVIRQPQRLVRVTEDPRHLAEEAVRTWHLDSILEPTALAPTRRPRAGCSGPRVGSRSQAG